MSEVDSRPSYSELKPWRTRYTCHDHQMTMYGDNITNTLIDLWEDEHGACNYTIENNDG